MPTKMIQIRHVPEVVHRRLRARAALAGMTLSDFLRQELEGMAARLTPDEVRERLAKLEPVRLSASPTDMIRKVRDAG